jgi:hypothetical protein
LFFGCLDAVPFDDDDCFAARSLAHSILRRLDTSVLICLDARFDPFAHLDPARFDTPLLACSLGYFVCGQFDVHFNASRSTMLIPSMLVRLEILPLGRYFCLL